MDNDISLLNYSLIRPITLARYGYIKNRNIDREELNILDLANIFVDKGISYGLRGDLLFILVLYINNLEMNKIPADYDYFGLGKSENCESSVDNIMKYLDDMNQGNILYESDNTDDLTIGDFIRKIKPPGYDKSLYSSFTEAKYYNDTYLDQFISLYNIIYEFEKRILLIRGESVKQIIKIDKNDKLYEDDITSSNKISSKYNNNNKIVIYSNHNNKLVAILLSQNHHCPCVYTDDKEYYIREYKDKFDIVDADTIGREG